MRLPATWPHPRRASSRNNGTLVTRRNLRQAVLLTPVPRPASTMLFSQMEPTCPVSPKPSTLTIRGRVLFTRRSSATSPAARWRKARAGWRPWRAELGNLERRRHGYILERHAAAVCAAIEGGLPGGSSCRPARQDYSGGILHSDLTKLNWLQDTLAEINTYPDHDAGNWFFDSVADHSYIYPWGTWYHLWQASEVLKTYTITNKSLWVTESGAWLCDDYPGPPCLSPLDGKPVPNRANLEEQAAFVIENAVYSTWINR